MSSHDRDARLQRALRMNTQVRSHLGRLVLSVLVGAVTATLVLVVLGRYLAQAERDVSVWYAMMHLGTFVMLLGAIPALAVGAVVLRFTRSTLTRMNATRRRLWILGGAATIGAALAATPFVLLFRSVAESWVFLLVGAASGVSAGMVLALGEWSDGGHASAP